MPRGPKPNETKRVSVEDASKILPLVRRVKRRGETGYKGGPFLFHEFIRKVYPSYRFGRVHQEITRQLQGVLDGKVKRLLVQIPPQTGKSLLISQLLPAAFLTKNPTARVGLCSYSATLAKESSYAARELYSQAGGQLATTLVDNWRTKQDGGMWIAGTGGTVTGRSNSQLLIVDDPISGLEDAESTTAMDKLWDWYCGEFRARKQPNSAMIIVHTRWGSNDLISRLMNVENEGPDEARENWVMLDLPALYEPPDVRPMIPDSISVVPDWRTQQDEVLCTFRQDLKSLKSMRATNPKIFAAVFQQRPIPEGGNVFNINNLGTYKTADISYHQFSRRIISVDCSFTGSSKSDYVAITHIGDAMPNFYVLDVWRKQLNFLETLDLILSIYRDKQPGAIVVEAAANGHAVMQTLKTKLPGVIPFGHTRRTGKMGYAGKRKVSNAMAVTPMVDAGNVLIPDQAPWLDVWLSEMAAFPGSPKDDQVDSFVMGMLYMIPKFDNILTEATWEGEQPALMPY